MQVLITGADGKIGRMLRLLWAAAPPPGLRPVWAARRAAGTDVIAWDIEFGPPPHLDPGAVVLHLVGRVCGDAAALRSNSVMAVNVCAAAKASGARHVFLASSAAVYGARAGHLAECHPPAPQTDYGRAKRDMEKAALCWARGAVGADGGAPGVTCLRIGNVLGADALSGAVRAGRDIVLDRVPGSDRGPLRSYIGPQTLADILAGLLGRVAAGDAMPPILNIAARTPVFMGDLLQGVRVPYRFGPLNAAALPRVCLSTKRLAQVVAVADQPVSAMIGEWLDVMALAS